MLMNKMSSSTFQLEAETFQYPFTSVNKYCQQILSPNIGLTNNLILGVGYEFRRINNNDHYWHFGKQYNSIAHLLSLTCSID